MQFSLYLRIHLIENNLKLLSKTPSHYELQPGVDYGLHRKKSSATIRSHAANTKPTKQTPTSARKADFRCWNHLPADLLRLVTNRLNYQERVCLRATCKNWNFIKYSANDLIHGIPLRIVALILMKISSGRFKNFFNFLILWIKIKMTQQLELYWTIFLFINYINGGTL